VIRAKPARKSSPYTDGGESVWPHPSDRDKALWLGKILFMGTDGAWRWRKGVEDKYHYRFWGQVVRWMAYQRNMSKGENMRSFIRPTAPARSRAHIECKCREREWRPAARWRCHRANYCPSGKTASVRLAPAGEDAWGFSRGSSRRRNRVTIMSTSLRRGGSALDATVSVQA